jgi:hypothetical protein
MNIEKIIQNIENQYVENIKTIEPKSLDFYLAIKLGFENREVLSRVFQKKYTYFYILRYMKPEVKSLYFEILERESQKNAFEIRAILKELFDAGERLEFSFVTKMYHTIDNKMPIYDNNVAKLFGFSVHLDAGYSTKVERYLDFYEELKTTYKLILEKNLLQRSLIAFDEKFKNPLITQEKKIDFILWKAGS